MDAAVKLGRNPVRKHQVHPEYGDEQADVGRDCQTTRGIKLSGANGDRETIIFPVQSTTSKIGNLTRLMFTEKHEKLGYSPNSNMRCKLHVVGSLFLRGCVWKSPAWFFRRLYQFSCMYGLMWLSFTSVCL